MLRGASSFRVTSMARAEAAVGVKREGPGGALLKACHSGVLLVGEWGLSSPAVSRDSAPLKGGAIPFSFREVREGVGHLGDAIEEVVDERGRCAHRQWPGLLDTGESVRRASMGRGIRKLLGAVCRSCAAAVRQAGAYCVSARSTQVTLSSDGL